MDFTKLRAAAMQDGDDEEAVTVNTRALIDKVLARYSGEWTTLRELIQNAADAQATTVKIKFETIPSTQVPLPSNPSSSDMLKHVLQHHTLKQLLVTNNGQAFGVNDWGRLKRIAEGNPDETKIGAFGVGFYSVFADCENPFVSSGPEAMAFYWKGNSLFTKKLRLPPNEANPDTSFVLEYRNTTTPMPNLLSIAQFLATSLTFVALEELELYVDDWKIISLRKKTSPSIPMPIARNVDTKTKEGLMKVDSLGRESVQMDATFMNVVGWKPAISTTISKPGYEQGYGNTEAPSLRSFFSRLTTTSSQAQLKTKAMMKEKEIQEKLLDDLTALTTANVFLRVTTAVVKTKVSTNFAAELERATKKPPPKTTKVAILTSSYEESAVSTAKDIVAEAVDVFASVLPGKKPGGRIFIGFPTHQTTGAGMHLSAPSVIPTVERESIDLNARWVRTWNTEMLRVAGIMSRLAFTNEMSDLSDRVNAAVASAGHGTKVTKAEVARFLPQALHILNTFTFSESTPAAQVSNLMDEAFWTCYSNASIEIFSTRGVLPTTRVRIATEDLSGFVEGIPVIPDGLLTCKFVDKLRDFELITEITISDVKKELEAKALTKEQLTHFISWAGKKAYEGGVDGGTLQSLLDVAVATISGPDGSGEVIALSSIKHFLNVNKIPADVPLPPSTLPFEFTKARPIFELQALGWVPLEIVPWLRFLVEARGSGALSADFTSDAAFAAQVLKIVSQSWDGLGSVARDAISAMLGPLTVIPTKCGMKKPGEAFFQSVKLFDDLPIMTSCPGVKEKFLGAIGVRKTVDLETIFARLLKPVVQAEGKNNTTNRHMDLIKYLASVKDDIPVEDLNRLKKTPLCPAEAGPRGLESTEGSARLYCASELFEPKEALRELGLPLLQWPGPPGSYRLTSTEGRFLTLLGIRAHPSVPELINLLGANNPSLRGKALVYFISNHHMNGYASFNVGATKTAFLPVQGDGKRLVTPAECFTNERCSILGFDVLSKSYQSHANKFGVAIDPPISQCVAKLLSNPPQTRKDAVDVFEYFSTRLGEIGPEMVARLVGARFVPIIVARQSSNGFPSEKVSNSERKLVTPRQCYVGNSPTYREIFDFVDFGIDANTFLLKCGSKHEPTKLELAALACQEPARLLGIMQSPEKYLNLLRILAESSDVIKRDRALFKQMKESKFLLGSIEIPVTKEKEKSKPRLSKHLLDDGDDSDMDDMEDAPIKQWQLATPGQIIIVDDYNSYRIFRENLIAAPEEEKLEEFYLSLGAHNLSDLIQEDLRVGTLVSAQLRALKLQKHILERAKLFLHEYGRTTIKHDARWLDKYLNVQIVDHILLRRSLRGQNLSNTEKRTAACTMDRSGLTLYVTENCDNYQISLAISKHLLERPNQQAYLTFETFLNLKLVELRSRGYNVERIIRAKAAEARIAEEERQKQVRLEQIELKQQEAEWKQKNETSHVQTTGLQAENPKSNSKQNMPGSFDDSPPSPVEPVKRNRGGLFSNIRSRFGIDRDSQAQEQLHDLLGGDRPGSSKPNKALDAPPSYHEAEQGGSGRPKSSDRPKSADKPTNPHAIQQNLVNAIQSSRAHDSINLFSNPTTQVVKEQAAYCDSTPGQNLRYLANSSNGTRIFIKKDVSDEKSTQFLPSNVASINAFAGLLHDICDVYSLSRQAIHIFHDDGGNTIAFNMSGSVFCNFRFWKALHEQKVLGGSKESKIEAGSYWWIVVAHELAHNLVKEHNAEHSFYTEMLVANYFSKMVAKTGQYVSENGN